MHDDAFVRDAIRDCCRYVYDGVHGGAEQQIRREPSEFIYQAPIKPRRFPKVRRARGEKFSERRKKRKEGKKDASDRCVSSNYASQPLSSRSPSRSRARALSPSSWRSYRVLHPARSSKRVFVVVNGA